MKSRGENFYQSLVLVLMNVKEYRCSLEQRSSSNSFHDTILEQRLRSPSFSSFLFLPGVLLFELRSDESRSPQTAQNQV